MKRPSPRSRLRPAPAASPQPLPVLAAPLSLPALDGAWRLGAWILAFFAPAAGLVLFLIYGAQASPRARSLGRACLVLALLGSLDLTGMDDAPWIRPYW